MPNGHRKRSMQIQSDISDLAHCVIVSSTVITGERHHKMADIRHSAHNLLLHMMRSFCSASGWPGSPEVWTTEGIMHGEQSRTQRWWLHRLYDS